MSRNERERLKDIKEAIAAIHAHLAAAAARKDDPLLHDALLFQFVVIGEAVKHLTSETREAAPTIPWADVAGLRDLIAHEYFRIDIDRVLEIIRRRPAGARTGHQPPPCRVAASLLVRPSFVPDQTPTPRTIGLIEREASVAAWRKDVEVGDATHDPT